MAAAIQEIGKSESQWDGRAKAGELRGAFAAATEISEDFRTKIDAVLAKVASGEWPGVALTDKFLVTGVKQLAGVIAKGDIAAIDAVLVKVVGTSSTEFASKSHLQKPFAESLTRFSDLAGYATDPGLALLRHFEAEKTAGKLNPSKEYYYIAQEIGKRYPGAESRLRGVEAPERVEAAASPVAAAGVGSQAGAGDTARDAAASKGAASEGPGAETAEELAGEEDAPLAPSEIRGKIARLDRSHATVVGETADPEIAKAFSVNAGALMTACSSNLQGSQTLEAAAKFADSIVEFALDVAYVRRDYDGQGYHRRFRRAIPEPLDRHIRECQEVTREVVKWHRHLISERPDLPNVGVVGDAMCRLVQELKGFERKAEGALDVRFVRSAAGVLLSIGSSSLSQAGVLRNHLSELCALLKARTWHSQGDQTFSAAMDDERREGREKELGREFQRAIAGAEKSIQSAEASLKQGGTVAPRPEQIINRAILDSMDRFYAEAHFQLVNGILLAGIKQELVKAGAINRNGSLPELMDIVVGGIYGSDKRNADAICEGIRAYKVSGRTLLSNEAVAAVRARLIGNVDKVTIGKEQRAVSMDYTRRLNVSRTYLGEVRLGSVKRSSNETAERGVRLTSVAPTAMREITDVRTVGHVALAKHRAAIERVFTGYVRDAQEAIQRGTAWSQRFEDRFLNAPLADALRDTLKVTAGDPVYDQVNVQVAGWVARQVGLAWDRQLARAARGDQWRQALADPGFQRFEDALDRLVEGTHQKWTDRPSLDRETRESLIAPLKEEIDRLVQGYREALQNSQPTSLQYQKGSIISRVGTVIESRHRELAAGGRRAAIDDQLGFIDRRLEEIVDRANEVTARAAAAQSPVVARSTLVNELVTDIEAAVGTIFSAEGDRDTGAAVKLALLGEVGAYSSDLAVARFDSRGFESACATSLTSQVKAAADRLQREISIPDAQSAAVGALVAALATKITSAKDKLVRMEVSEDTRTAINETGDFLRRSLDKTAEGRPEFQSKLVRAKALLEELIGRRLEGLDRFEGKKALTKLLQKELVKL